MRWGCGLNDRGQQRAKRVCCSARFGDAQLRRSFEQRPFHRLRHLDRQEPVCTIAIVFSALVYDSEISSSFGVLVGYEPIELAQFEGSLVFLVDADNEADSRSGCSLHSSVKLPSASRPAAFPRRGHFLISDRGREVLKAAPSRIDIKFLENFDCRPLGNGSSRSVSEILNSAARTSRASASECSWPLAAIRRSGIISDWKSGTAMLSLASAV